MEQNKEFDKIEEKRGKKRFYKKENHSLRRSQAGN